MGQRQPEARTSIGVSLGVCMMRRSPVDGASFSAEEFLATAAPHPYGPSESVRCT